MTMELKRRGFLLGLGALIAAPAIVRIEFSQVQILAIGAGRSVSIEKYAGRIGQKVGRPGARLTAHVALNGMANHVSLAALL
jgi:hypothetical protein